MRRFIFILAACTLATACDRFDVEEILLDREDMSVTMRGKEICSFDPEKSQISFNEEHGEYRMFDEDFLCILTLKWSERPVSDGQTTLVDIEWETPANSRKKKGLEFEVRRIDGTGMVWLWNPSDKIGLTIKVF